VLLHTDIQRSSHLELHALDGPRLDLVGSPPLTLRTGRRFCIQALKLDAVNDESLKLHGTAHLFLNLLVLIDVLDNFNRLGHILRVPRFVVEPQLTPSC
jgi:hypothetical protein